MFIGSPDHLGKIILEKHSTFTMNQTGTDPGKRSSTPGFRTIDVTILFNQQLVTWLGVSPNCDLIGHGSGRHKHRGFHSQDFRSFFLKSLNRGIITPNIITHFGFGHNLPHFRGRFGYRVASQINHSNSNSIRSIIWR